MSTSSIGDFITEIGQRIVEVADDATGNILLHSVVRDGVISAEMFYPIGTDSTIIYRGRHGLENLVYSFWETWKETPGEKEWRIMQYFVIGGEKIDVNFLYPDQVDEGEDLLERRNRTIFKYFGDVNVDYSGNR